jgi:heme/copper-type cytochrome/quinol oxidase subunit 4
MVGGTGCGVGERCCQSCTPPVAVCGDGVITPPEVCDTNGNIGCSGATPICRADCGACVAAALPVEDEPIVVEPAADGDGAIGLTTKPISKILKDLIKWLLQIVILLAILMLIVSGVMYMISSGDAEKANTAKRAFSYAILGLLVAGLAWAIVKTVVDLLS